MISDDFIEKCLEGFFYFIVVNIYFFWDLVNDKLI